MRIYIVRHGETNMNREKIFQGRYDEPLNDFGRKLAEISGRALKGVRFDMAISSPLSRAKETVETILRESENPDTELLVDDRIQEIDVGDWTLRKINDVNDPEYEHMKSFFDNPFHCLDIPNGENVHDVIKRTQSFLRELVEKDDDKTYLVGMHGFSLRAMLNQFYEDKENFWQEKVPYNCCFNIIDVKNGVPILKEKDIYYYSDDNLKDYYK